jgi:hypothetical protein
MRLSCRVNNERIGALDSANAIRDGCQMGQLFGSDEMSPL